MKESKIINYLQSERQDKAFARLYKYFPKVEKHILVNSGSKEEALDIFQDALVILYRKVTSDPTFGSPESPIKVDGYLINTCKLLWSNELRKKKVRNGDESGLEKLVFEDEIQVKIEKENSFKTLENVLNSLGKKCRNILSAFYYESCSMEGIAKKFGYATVKSAKVQKYKCMDSARKMALEITNDQN